jgi:hypothetical protein
MDTQNKKHLQMPEGLEIYIDDDVKLVIEFILRNVESTKRIKVANAVKDSYIFGGVVSVPPGC